MNTGDLIRHMCEGAGLSLRSASEKMGRAPTFLSSTLSRGRSVNVETLVEIAAACGYRLEAVGDGERVEVTR